jgi:Cu(I)/Ag(I) efflux system membrane fusion protein
MKRTLVLALLGGAALGAAAFGGYRFAMHRMMDTPAPQADAKAAADRKVLYWHDPMFPQQKFDKPGKSPFMDMQLVPVYADSGAGAGPGVSVSAAAAQNLGVRTATAEEGSLEPRMEAVGSVAWNERNLVQLQARSGGFVERLHARAPLDPVVRGAPLVEILFPEWAAAQEELLLLKRQGAEELAGAARRRLALLGMSEAQIRDVEQSGQVRTRFTLHSPINGVVAELGVREGMTVTPGATLFRIVDLSTVWVNAEVPEAQAAWLKPGAPVEARVPAWPEDVFKGRVNAILPELNAATRTVRARIELANPGARLKPGMFANLAFSAGRGKPAVLVPSEAVIRTGERNVVILSVDGRFVPAEVAVGQEMGGRTEIVKGLKAGEKVVASGQFLIDSEASLKGALARLEGGGAKPAAGKLHPGSGRVLEIDAAKGRIELSHGPMPTINWPAMQMGFMVADPKALAGIGKGDTVEFEMRGDADKDGNYVIETIRKKDAK